MLYHRILRKDGIHLTGDGTEVLAANVLNYLNVNLEKGLALGLQKV